MKKRVSQQWLRGFFTELFEENHPLLLLNPMAYYAYILKSMKDNGYYFGQTANLDDRLKKHNSGRVRSTNGRRPFLLHYKEEFETRSEAFGREQFFKSLEGRNWLKENRIID